MMIIFAVGLGMLPMIIVAHAIIRILEKDLDDRYGKDRDDL